MLTYYCPNCWTIIDAADQVCPACGYKLEAFHERTYEDKLLAALRHSVPERRIMAAQILGSRGSVRALPEFLKIVASGESDYFFLRAVLLAAAKIDHPDRELILKQAEQHSSELVARLAKELLDQLSKNRELNTWDRHTG